MSLIGNVDTPAEYVASYMQACVGMLGIPAGGFVEEIEGFGADTGYDVESLYSAMLNSSVGRGIYAPGSSNETFAAKLVEMLGGSLLEDEEAAVDEVLALLDGGMSRAQAAMTAVEFVANMETSDDVYGDVAQQFQNRITIANYYTFQTTAPSSSAAALTAVLAGVDNETDVSEPEDVLDGVDGGSNEAAQDFVLTTTQDVRTGGNNADFFRGVAGVAVGSQDQTTLNSSDILDGGAGEDTLIVNMTGAAYSGGARVKNIETLQIGTNLAAAAFDYNVNQGSNEITEVTTVVADQINAGEDLTINNILKTGDATPALHWKNEAGSTAGEVDYNYRSSAVSGTTTQAITLTDVSAGMTAAGATASSGVLNIAQGVETFSITSAGTGPNTLNNSEFVSATGVAADLVSGTAGLTKVVVTGATAFGKAATVIDTTTDAGFGQTNRAVGSDLGLDVATATARADSSNLVSLANTVTEYDASAATGAQSVRFTANANGTAVNVTFKGGSANDYVEFELGNISADGGAGDDTMAFINTGANSTFGEGDTMVGGDGSDTIQIGLNGVGTYNISETELRNKTSFGTLDLRGTTTNLTLSSDFVAAADTANSITILTNKIVQTSDTNAANNTTVTTWNALENASTHTVDLTMLGSGQSVNFQGGSGSDRIIVSDATFNVLKTLNGGSREGATIAAGAARYDTITVRTNGENVVIDAQDLSNVSGMEGFVLTKNSASATYNITLTQNFLTNNTEASNSTSTGINDTIFQITTGAAANNAALAAGDTVNINVADLLNATNTALATTWTGARDFDITSLENAGVTVNFIGNGGATVTAATLRGLGALVANGADTSWTDVLSSGASATAVTNLAFTIAAGTDATGGVGNDTFTATAALTAGSTLNGAGGTDTLTLIDAAADNISNVSNIEIINVTAGATAKTITVGVDTVIASGQTLQIGATGMTSALTATFAAETNGAILVSAGTGADLITGGAGNDTISGGTGANQLDGGAGNDTISTGDTAAFITGGAGNDTITAGNGGNQIQSTSGNDSITAGTGADLITAGTGSDVINAGTGANVIRLNVNNGSATVNAGGGTDNISVGTGNDVINLAAGGSETVGIASSTFAAFDGTCATINNFDTANDQIKTGIAGATVYTLNIATSTNGGLAGNIQTALAGLGGYAYAAGEAYLVSVAAGEAAGTYIVEDLATAGLQGTDLIVKVGTITGTLTAADFIV